MEGLTETDYFGNTVLHYSVAALSMPYKFFSLVLLIDLGLPVHAVNTFGQTFLHVLPSNPIERWDWSFFDLLMTSLRGKGFDFSRRDHYGRTILHTFLPNVPSDMFPLITIKMIVREFNPDLQLSDIFGRKVFQLETNNKYARYDPALSSLRSSFLGKHVAITLTSSIIRAQHLAGVAECHQWADEIIRKGLVNWVDINGNSPLLALLKYWPGDDSLALQEIAQKLVQAGAERHMRDREGNNALAIETIRGRRPFIFHFIAFDKMANTRNFAGEGILVQASRARRNAKANGDDALYARILSCSKLIAEAGALRYPTERDEWILSGL